MIKTLLLNTRHVFDRHPRLRGAGKQCRCPATGALHAGMKFADVFGRRPPLKGRRDKFITQSCGYRRSGGGANIFLKHAVDDLLAPVATGSPWLPGHVGAQAPVGPPLHQLRWLRRTRVCAPIAKSLA